MSSESNLVWYVRPRTMLLLLVIIVATVKAFFQISDYQNRPINIPKPGENSVAKERNPSFFDYISPFKICDTYKFWCIPIERNPNRRIPSITVPLTDVYFFNDKRHGWVVGKNGLALYTINAGEKWAPPNAQFTNEDLLCVWFSAWGQTGWIVGRNGAIFSTKDGGLTWAAQSSKTQYDLNSVVFGADGLHGWAAGDHGTLLLTTDGGVSWSLHESGTKSTLRKVVFDTSGHHGLAVGDNGVVVSSEDDGETWQAKNSGTKSNLSNVIWFESKQKAWATSASGESIVSDDQGSTWHKVTTPRPWNVDEHPSSIESKSAIGLNDGDQYADSACAWIPLDNFIIQISCDRGKHWRAQYIGIKNPNSLYISKGGDFRLAIDEFGNIAKSIDYGESWHLLARAEPNSQASEADSAATGSLSGIHRQDAYLIFPAPWYFLLLVASLFVGYWCWGKRERDGISSALINDSPILKIDQDRYEHRRIALALVKLMQSVDTKPPMTVAITGPWGCGKSSVMNMVADKLKFTRPVISFNAWHHSDDTQLLASLLEHLRNDIALVDDILARISLRIKLFYHRFIKRNFVVFGAIIATVTLIVVISNLQKYYPWQGLQKQLAYDWLQNLSKENGFVLDRGFVKDDGKTAWIESEGKWHESENQSLIWTDFTGTPSLPLRVSCLPALSNAIDCAYLDDKRLEGWLINGEGRLCKYRAYSGIVCTRSTPEHSAELVDSKKASSQIPPIHSNSVKCDSSASSSDTRFTALAVRGDTKKSTLWLATACGEILRSTNNGQDWQTMSVPSKLSISSLGFYPDQKTGWLFTRAGDIFVSTDSGSHWQLQAPVKLTENGDLPAPTLGQWISTIVHHDWSKSDPFAIILFGAAGLIFLIFIFFAWVGSIPFMTVRSHASTLWHSLRNLFSLANTEKDAGFRHMFRKEFSLYTSGCPHPPLIIIDDLDRCHPDRVVAILEAVNFLADCGKCYILLGLDWEKITHAVGLHFEKIAAEMHDDASEGRSGRYQYACNYLDKIINLRIAVPSVPSEDLI